MRTVSDARIARAGDAALARYERLLERAIEREGAKVDDLFNDPMTQYYGIGEEMAPLVYARGRDYERTAEGVWLELYRRGLRRWGNESEAQMLARRLQYLRPLPAEYRAVSDYYHEFLEFPNGWDDTRLSELADEHFSAVMRGF